ncbi:MAG TPA: hypothetical protein VK612_13035 [Pyrinomonadaceae bacterium]|nr:hypothetical protein [Pyrinomonadaceae bacterium]
MNKVKLDERFENALNAFFDIESDYGETAVARSRQNDLILAQDETFGEKADKISSIVREVVLFGPGTFLLYYMTLSLAFFYPTLGITLEGLFMFLSGIFMVYAGSGSLNKTKNLAVPSSIVGLAAIIALFASLFTPTLQPDLYFWYSIYLFPVALIVARLVRNRD